MPTAALRRRPLLTRGSAQATATAAAPVPLLSGIRFNIAAPGAVGRMTPEGIYLIATDRADAIRLLRLHGYLI